MKERWNRPVKVLDIHQSATQGIWLPDGRVHGAVELELDEESIERIRTGYVCAKCLLPFEHAWPERCPDCGAPIRTEQAEYFAREYGGEETTRGFDLGDEIARMHDELERQRKEGNGS